MATPEAIASKHTPETLLLTLALTFLAAPAAAQEWVDRDICVVENGQMQEVPARYNRATGDTTTADGTPFSSRYPIDSEYALRAAWYINNEPIEPFSGATFVKYGLTRIIGATEVTRVGEYYGVGMFAEAGAERIEMLYVPVRPGCELQPYQLSTGTAPPVPAGADPAAPSDPLTGDAREAEEERLQVQVYEADEFTVRGRGPDGGVVSLREIWFTPSFTAVRLRFHTEGEEYGGTLNAPGTEYALSLRDRAGTLYSLRAQSGWFGTAENFYGPDGIPPGAIRDVILLFDPVPPENRDGIDVVEGTCSEGCWRFLNVDLEPRPVGR